MWNYYNAYGIITVEVKSMDNVKGKAVIDVRDLYKIYKVGTNKVRALNGVSFQVYEGEFCAIVGTSGSGKSTLLNMMAGLEKPTKGQIIINGHHIEKLNENQLVKFRGKHVGFIFQSFNLMGTMNAVENVAMPLMFRGVKKKERIDRAKKMLKLVGLSDHMKHRPNQMSGGQQQRVAIARAISTNPTILLADEPTGALDQKTGKQVMELFHTLNDEGRTIIMITHDAKIASHAKRIVRILDGNISEGALEDA